ncbi:MAG TPA: transglycosylase SLT domain-containing protein [Gemmatimonadales bacterium]|jgi:soluble lytic murein transglycosylase-like protein|nr:transglycosylase SLT domain-containing protein [Gemmatimonadales bacterium]
MTTAEWSGRWQRARVLIERLVVRAGLVLSAGLLLSALGGWSEVRARAVADSTAAARDAVTAHIAGDFDTKLDRAHDELRLVRAELDRAVSVSGYARRYGITPELARAIYDAAAKEGIPSMLAFRLVQVESNFKRQARSSADALGLTQVQLATARAYDRQATEADLFDRDTNLRMGFRYLKDLLEQFDGDMHLALLAYNRGPGRVEQILAEGGDPGNGYAGAVLRRPKASAVSVRGIPN